jgi:hypothetical protein
LDLPVLCAPVILAEGLGRVVQSGLKGVYLALLGLDLFVENSVAISTNLI